jgi:colanic acid biosynthesis glycosyl transferase WcaI
MCKRWVCAGHDVTVITCAPNHPDGVVYEGYKNNLYQSKFIDGIRTIRVWTYIAANEGTIKRIGNFLSYMVSATLAGLLIKRPDVVIATSPQFFCGWAGFFVAWLKCKPFILEIRDLWPETISAIGAIGNQRVLRILEYLERRLYAAATHIVTVGDGYKAKLVEKKVASNDITVITNGADLDLFNPRKPNAELIKRYGLKGRFVCAYVGTIGMCSGLDVVLRAAQVFKEMGHDNFRFLMVGDGAEKSVLEQKASDQGLDNVIFSGRQPKELVPNFISIADACLIHLKKLELFRTVLPSKIFEAMAMAKPVILGVEGNAADLICGSDTGICIEPENELELVAAIKRLAVEGQQAWRFGRNGRTYVIKYFNRDTLANDYLKLMHRILACNDKACLMNGKR